MSCFSSSDGSRVQKSLHRSFISSSCVEGSGAHRRLGGWGSAGPYGRENCHLSAVGSRCRGVPGSNVQESTLVGEIRDIVWQSGWGLRFEAAGGEQAHIPRTLRGGDNPHRLLRRKPAKHETCAQARPRGVIPAL